MTIEVPKTLPSYCIYHKSTIQSHCWMKEKMICTWDQYYLLQSICRYQWICPIDFYLDLYIDDGANMYSMKFHWYEKNSQVIPYQNHLRDILSVQNNLKNLNSLFFEALAHNLRQENWKRTEKFSELSFKHCSSSSRTCELINSSSSSKYKLIKS